MISYDFLMLLSLGEYNISVHMSNNVSEFRTSYIHPVLIEIKGLNLTVIQQHHGGPLLVRRHKWTPMNMYEYVEQGENLTIITSV